MIEQAPRSFELSSQPMKPEEELEMLQEDIHAETVKQLIANASVEWRMQSFSGTEPE